MNPESAQAVGELLRCGREILKENGEAAYQVCAEALLKHTTGLSREKLLSEPGLLIGDEAKNKYFSCLKRFLKNEPLQYITNTREFMSLEFYVDGTVLIPRPDTETLVEAALEVLPMSARVLDIGTGSGCIAVALAKYRPDLQVTAVDVSDTALCTARRNAAAHDVCIEFVRYDIRDINAKHAKAEPLPGEPFYAVISNPPYIRTNDIAGLDACIRDYEPVTALDGGMDGLDFYRVITAGARRLLGEAGMVLFEIGADQADAVRGIMSGAGLGDIWVKKDLAGHARVIGAVIRGR